MLYVLKRTRYYMYVAGPNEIINATAPPLQRSIPRDSGIRRPDGWKIQSSYTERVLKGKCLQYMRSYYNTSYIYIRCV